MTFYLSLGNMLDGQSGKPDSCNQAPGERRFYIINLPLIPSRPDMIGQFLINQQDCHVDFDVKGQRLEAAIGLRIHFPIGG